MGGAPAANHSLPAPRRHARCCGMKLVGPFIRRLAALALLSIGVALAGCATPVPQPALVAKSEAGDYGYAETKLSDTRYEMVYESPEIDISVDRSARE